jgi:hypothetical protein
MLTRAASSNSGPDAPFRSFAEFAALCACESSGYTPHHFGKNLNVKDDGKLYIKDVLVEDAEYKSMSTRKSALRACMSKAVFHVEKYTSSCDTYSPGDITRRIWKLFTTYRDEWMSIRRGNNKFDYTRKLEKDKIDKNRGMMKRIQKEQTERNRVGDSIFNSRMRNQGAIKMSTEKVVTESELKKFKEWYTANKLVYESGMINCISPHFIDRLPNGLNKKSTLLVASSKRNVLDTLNIVQNMSSATKFHCSAKVQWDAYTDKFPSAYCFTSQGKCPILHHDRVQSGYTFPVVIEIKPDGYIVTDTVMELYKVFEKKWERFNCYNPKKMKSLNICYDVSSCLQQITLTSQNQIITIDISSACATHTFSVSELCLAMDYDPLHFKIADAVDNRIKALQQSKKDKISKVRDLSVPGNISVTPTKEEMRKYINNTYSNGLISIENYFKALSELD